MCTKCLWKSRLCKSSTDIIILVIAELWEEPRTLPTFILLANTYRRGGDNTCHPENRESSSDRFYYIRLKSSIAVWVAGRDKPWFGTKASFGTRSGLFVCSGRTQRYRASAGKFGFCQLPKLFSKLSRIDERDLIHSTLKTLAS